MLAELVFQVTCFVVLKKMHLVGIAKKDSEGRFLNFFCEPVMKNSKNPFVD